MIHDLKTLAPYFAAVVSGEKTFEVRKNDRDFHVGDFLMLNEIEVIQETQRYTGRYCVVRVTYVLTNEEYVKPGYAILAIEPCMIMFANDKTNREAVPVYKSEVRT